MRNSSEAPMRKEKKVSRHKTCVSNVFLQIPSLSVDLISRGNARDLLSFTEMWRFPAFCRKRLFGFFVFKSAQLTNKTNPVYLSYCRSGSRHVGRTVGGEKKTKMEVSMPSSKVTRILRSVDPCWDPPSWLIVLPSRNLQTLQELKEWELHLLAVISVINKATLPRGLKASVIL